MEAKPCSNLVNDPLLKTLQPFRESSLLPSSNLHWDRTSLAFLLREREVLEQHFGTVEKLVAACRARSKVMMCWK